MIPHRWIVEDPYVPPGQFFGIPATIGYDMESENARHNAEPSDPLDRTLAGHDTRIKALAKHVDVSDAALSRRIARLERKDVSADADVAKGRRLLGSLLVLIGRRLRDEEDE